MILVGIEGCPACDEARDDYPDLDYVKLTDEKSVGKVLDIKKALLHLGVDTFPVLLSDDLTKVLPWSEICLVEEVEGE